MACTTYNCCSGCELIKTNKVLCDGQHTLDINQELIATVPNTAGFADTDTLTLSNEDFKIFSTGCNIVYNGDGSFTITFSGFIICESFTLTNETGLTQNVELVNRICDPGSITFNCKINDACVTDPKCQVENITADITFNPANIVITSSTLTITQTLNSVTIDLVIEEIVQMLVQLCNQSGGTVTISS